MCDVHRTIDIERYDRHRDKPRAELTLVQRTGKRLVGTGTTLPVFNYSSPVSGQEKDLVDLTGIEPVTS